MNPFAAGLGGLGGLGAYLGGANPGAYPVAYPGRGRKPVAAKGGVARGAGVTIKKIEKIFNCVIYEKFMNEFRRMIRKYPHLQITDMMKHLFHGCN